MEFMYISVFLHTSTTTLCLKKVPACNFVKFFLPIFKIYALLDSV